MDFLGAQIDEALDAHLYYLAVVCALTMPDICSALESEDGTTTKAKYQSWCDTWLMASYPRLSTADLYSMRCGVVHQGKLGHPDLQYSHILFTLPRPNAVVYHNNITQDALNLDLETFCRDMVDSVHRWYDQAKNAPYVKANLPHIVRLYPKGLPPYFVGVPLIS